MSGTSDIQDYLNQNQTQSDASIAAAQNRDKVTPSGALNFGTATTVSNNTTLALGNNPIIATGTDIINSVVTTTTQNLVKGALKTATGALKPLQTASDAFFTGLALASTASVEICMELARGNARLIVTNINKKEAIITQLNTEATALYNAVAIILNSQPFFTPYFNQLIAAYQDISQADTDMKVIVAQLRSPTRPFYNNVLFDAAIKLLNQAEGLILPDRTANTSSIRSTVLSTASNSIAQAKDAAAAASTIPGISAQIAKLMVQYASLTLEINGLIALFLTALNSFISTFKRNSNIDNATINHLNSGISQLDDLLGKMNPLLFPTPTVRGNALYPANVTTNATSWGITLQSIIQWLLINPGAASQNLNITGASVQAYNQAVALLNGYGNRTFGNATLLVSASQENFLNTGNQVVQILFDANTVLATTKNPRNVLAEMQKFINLLQAAHSLDGDIVNALSPFIKTSNNLVTGANRVISDLTKTARGLGFDRVGNLLSKGDIANLFTTDATTATYVGAALGGVRAITEAVNKNPNATDQDKAQLSKVDTDLSSQNAVKQVEATRASTDSTDTFVADTQAQTAQTNQDGQAAIAIGAKYSPTEAASSSDVDTLSGNLKDVTGNAFGELS